MQAVLGGPLLVARGRGTNKGASRGPSGQGDFLRHGWWAPPCNSCLPKGVPAQMLAWACPGVVQGLSHSLLRNAPKEAAKKACL